MKLPIWIWYPLSNDYPGVVGDSDDSHIPMSEAIFKSHEGASLFYAEARFKEIASIYHEQGIEASVWCVPRGTRTITGEIDAAVLVAGWLGDAGLRPRVQLDVEQDTTSDFWKGTSGQLVQLVGGIRQGAPAGTQIDLCLYQYGTEVGLSLVGPMVDRFVTMDYWTDFQTTPEARLEYSRRALEPYGKPIVYGLPGNAAPGDMQRGLTWVRDHGGLCCLWRRGTTSRAVYDVIDAFVMTEPQPAPAPVTEDGVRIGLALKVLTGDYRAARNDLDKMLVGGAP